MSLEKNSIYKGDAYNVLKRMEDSTIDYVISSPPYDARKEYEEQLGEEKYTQFLKRIFHLVTDKMKDDGRFAIVVPFRCGQKSGQWSRLKSVFNVIDFCNLNLRDLVIWNQQDVQGTAWGSFASISAPNIQYQTEYVVIGYKNQWKKINDGKSTISNQEFKDWTISNIWNIMPDHTNKHPAPFPTELVERCLKLFTYKNDLVLDPFMGSATSCVVAKKLGRDYIGIDKEEKYYQMAKKRLNQSLLGEFL